MRALALSGITRSTRDLRLADRVAPGTDAPVETSIPSPTTTRPSRAGGRLLMANQRLTRVKAPRLFTLGNAPDEEICTARGLYTIIGGQVLYELADTRN